MSELRDLVDAWRESVDAVLALEPADWDVPTDLAGWTAKDVLAHLVHLERALVDGDVGTVDGTVISGDYTNAGVASLRDVPVDQLRADLADLTARRARTLVELPDPDAPADNTPGGITWDWRTLLRNRAIDVWVHEQDIRRATGLPGGLDSPGAVVTTLSFAAALPFVLGRRSGAVSGDSVRWVVTGPIPIDTTIAVDVAGRAAPADVPARATVTMGTEAFTILGAGRRSIDDVTVRIEGDRDLALRALAGMSVTP